VNGGFVAFGKRSQKQAAVDDTSLRPASMARQLALAHALQRQVDAGEFTNYADLARALGFTRARVTQIMDLLLIAPDIQEEILFLETKPGAPQLSERSIRFELLHATTWAEQRAAWERLKKGLAEMADGAKEKERA
jgi:hypothetical protein